MEILAGARDDRHLDDLRRRFAQAMLMSTVATDLDDAAALSRRCRRHGESPRRLIDRLIPAIAIREGLMVLPADADSEVLARHTNLITA